MFPFKKKAISTRPYRDSSVRSFGQWITKQDWNDVRSGLEVNNVVDDFNHELKKAYQRSFPVTKSLLSVSDKPWMTHKVKSLMKMRDKAYKQKHSNSEQWLLLRNSVQSEIVKAKERYYRQSVHDLKTCQPSQWHKNIKKLCKLNSRCSQIPGADNDPKATAISINTHFAAICSLLPPLDFSSLPTYLPAEKPPIIYHGQVHAALRKIKVSKSGHPNDLPAKLIKEFAIELTEPLAHIFNKCIHDGIFPVVWKTAAITPIPKEKTVNSLDQLRPIALTPIFARVFESFIAKWIVDDIAEHIDKKQFGNVKGSSTVHYLVDLLRFVLEGLDKPGHYAYLSTIDFTKAFDRVNHNIVVKKLIELGVRRSIIPIICSFLTGRTQTTKIGKHTSPPLSTTCGVPQGTKLGPILFLILVNDALSSYENKWKYVDDLTIGEVVKRNQLTTLQNTLDNLSVWCQQNDVLPKPAKCNLMRVCFLRNMEPPTNFILNNVQLYVVPHLKLLGITIQDDLKWDIQCGKHCVQSLSKTIHSLHSEEV